jgi:hypothetical protein
MDLDDLYFDEECELKLLARDLTPDDVQRVFDNDPRFYKNAQDADAPYRRAPIIMVGETLEDQSGNRLLLAVPIEPFGGGLWRVVTAFEPSLDQAARYRSRK